ncbi:hypothetical protein TWF569_011973 [Orbilia oligospora]|uniref:Uncharacterized protein n=1 Tax=Orbilia oligospora TaxID=2813651 RepID=A0A7C8MV33_ORBOL|nr:hypothetical protein TWF102_012002 [Orbilia oligospora]KAF3081596.1 hypothetical protein TWF706_011989 [Orbilia oligospora]KAF3106245.1 hypothetical protein TWF103_012013 [Orbilia oligospora]KAF3137824.1 hypothetical protein TWF594_011876 [Orbilia oligospora]KAF3141923.1 hypothetical protein TWF569_011973 [Orbilia oligospora]
MLPMLGSPANLSTRSRNNRREKRPLLHGNDIADEANLQLGNEYKFYILRDLAIASSTIPPDITSGCIDAFRRGGTEDSSIFFHWSHPPSSEIKPKYDKTGSARHHSIIGDITKGNKQKKGIHVGYQMGGNRMQEC